MTQKQDTSTPSFPLLARNAACLFWMGRYLERAENLARLLDVTYTFTPASDGVQNWQSVLALHCDEEAFFARYKEISAKYVIRFYLRDDSHANSVISCLRMARLNATELRPLISTEMWMQVNSMYNDALKLPDAVTPRNLWHVLGGLRRQCQTFAGITEGGLYRDQSWYFTQCGLWLERADQMTRLLDIKYHLLLPSIHDIGSVMDTSQWFSLLRAASGYHAFRRVHPYRLTPSSVAGFLLFNRYFPRSVLASISMLGTLLQDMLRVCELTSARDILEQYDPLWRELSTHSIDQAIAQGLHEYLDRIQLHLGLISSRMSEKFF